MRQFVDQAIAVRAIIGPPELETGVLLAIRLRVPVMYYAE